MNKIKSIYLLKKKKKKERSVEPMHDFILIIGIREIYS